MGREGRTNANNVEDRHDMAWRNRRRHDRISQEREDKKLSGKRALDPGNETEQCEESDSCFCCITRPQPVVSSHPVSCPLCWLRLRPAW